MLTMHTVSIAQSVKKSNATISHKSIQMEADRIFKKLVALRRNFHQHPELAGHEARTQKIIKDYLINLGLEVDTSSYGYGLIGILRGGKKGNDIAWRADMDALAQDFPDDPAFPSLNKGVRHGCGHDIHLAVALGIAEVLSKNKASLPGTVYFLFQPEEETFLGAKAMVNEDPFNTITPAEIYGLHVTALPVGQIMVKSNELFAYQKRVRIKLKNELSTDQIKILSNAIHNALARSRENSKPWDLSLIGDVQLGLANPNTIYKDYLIMDNLSANTKNHVLALEGYLYETDSAKIKSIIPTIEEVIKQSGYKDQLISVSFSQSNPTVLNDDKLTATAASILTKIYGKDIVMPDYGQVPYFNDDFAYFQQKMPGTYFFLGGSNAAKGIVAMNHTPNFAVDEECIRTGVKCFSSLIWERLRHAY
ncbi:MAG: amidohydrolase [Pedobacter sp.]|nr:MAG: amidohydrolase [Pedobacter sp.]